MRELNNNSHGDTWEWGYAPVPYSPVHYIEHCNRDGIFLEVFESPEEHPAKCIMDAWQSVFGGRA